MMTDRHMPRIIMEEEVLDPEELAQANSVRLNFCMVAELSDATVRDG